jgi:ribosome biogenesis GTPase
MIGTIIKGIGGFYYVRSGDSVYETRGRGIFRKTGMTPTVGDIVEISELPEEGKGVLESIEPRKNIFFRPPVANVEKMITVIAPSDPEPNFMTTDKFLVIALKKGCEAAVCINKTDIASEEELEALEKRYSAFPVFRVSAAKLEGLDDILGFIDTGKAAFAGQSGVGKSSLVNALSGRSVSETGDVSQKNKRGRQTTRHVQLFQLDSGGMIFDTPGFSSFDVKDIKSSELDAFYPEFRPYRGECRFSNCSHVTEPGCSIREAVENGSIDTGRYETYCSLYKEIKDKENKY